MRRTGPTGHLLLISGADRRRSLEDPAAYVRRVNDLLLNAG